MKTFFSYYGSKYRLCQQGFYPKPKLGNMVIEPFAGSATYSVYHEPERAILIDKNPVIVGIWHYLINASERDILDLPNFQDELYLGHTSYALNDISEQYKALDEGAKNLIGFWMGKAQTRPAQRLTNWFVKYHNKSGCMVWNEYVKDRIISQLPKIRKWQAILGDYNLAYHQSLDFKNQTYFIDPPYSSVAGKKYKHNKINYWHLQWWIKQNKYSQIIACENQDLTCSWADFNQSTDSRNANNRVKKELVWVQ